MLSYVKHKTPTVLPAFTVLALGALYMLWAGPSHANAEGCYNNELEGANCVTVPYEIPLESHLAAPAALQTQFASFEAMAEEKKLGKIIMQNNSYNLYPGDSPDDKTWSLSGRVLYKLAGSKEAEAFVAALTDHLYAAALYDHQTTCYN